jgi:hypothetical protein
MGYVDLNLFILGLINADVSSLHYTELNYKISNDEFVRYERKQLWLNLRYAFLVPSIHPSSLPSID